MATITLIIFTPSPFPPICNLHRVSAYIASHTSWGGRILKLNRCSSRVPVVDCEFLGEGTDLWELELLEPVSTEQ